MYRPYRRVKDYVFHSPLLLSTITDPKLIQLANDMMPKSVGIEIECNMEPTTITNSAHNAIFRAIPNIIAVDNDSSEQRYRIPAGINGMIVLYKICELLKEHSTLNLGSGIHYHIDASNWMFSFSSRNEFEEILSMYYENNTRFDWMLDRVNHWNYKGNYNSRIVSTSKNAIRLHETNETIEFRTGEMTFDYELMIRRIISAQTIVKKLVSITKQHFLKRRGKRRN